MKCQFGTGQQVMSECKMIYIHWPGYFPTEELYEEALKLLCPNYRVEIMLCEKCKKREATETYVDSILSYVHGMSHQWCNYCVITTQLAYAREQSKRIPILEKELKLELLKMELEEKARGKET